MSFFAFFSLMCSSYILIAVTFERFYSITRPLKAASFNTVRKAIIIIMSLFLTCFLFCFPLLFIGTDDGDTCIVNRYASDNVLGEIYHWLSEIFTFIFPFVSLLTMNSVIIHTLRKRSKLILKESTDENQSEETMNHSEKQIFTMLLLVTFVFLTLNVPLRALVYYLNFSSGNTPYYYAGLHFFYHFGDKTYVTNHGIKFFLYVMSGQKLRTDLKNMFCSRKSKNLASNAHMVVSTLSSETK